MRSLAAFALAGVVACVAGISGPEFCDAGYQCKHFYQVGRTVYAYDLSPLCSSTWYEAPSNDSSVSPIDHPFSKQVDTDIASLPAPCAVEVIYFQFLRILITKMLDAR